MPKKEIVTVGPAAPNPNLSPATRFGNLVFVSGQTGRHPVTGEVGKDIREQTRNILERIKVVLTTAGTSLDNVLTATTYLTNRENLAGYHEEYGQYFPTNLMACWVRNSRALNRPSTLGTWSAMWWNVRHLALGARVASLGPGTSPNVWWSV